MKIVFLGRYNDSEILTGPEKVAKRIFGKYSENNRALFVEYFFDGNKYGFLKKLFGKEILLDTNTKKILRLGVVRIFFFLWEIKPEIIHIISFERFARVAFFYKKFRKVKIYYTVHGIIKYEDANNPEASRILKLKDHSAEGKFFKDADKLIFLSNRSVQTAEKYLQFDRNKVEIIPNGIDEVFHRNEIKKDINNKSLRIIFAGDSRRKEKGFDFFMKSIACITFPVEIFIIGNRSGEKINSNDNFVIFFKDKMNTNEFAAFLEDKDIYVSASTYEQFSIIAVESMAAGLVPVVTQETGMSTYINNGVNGFVFKAGDSNELINIITQLNSDRALIVKVSEEAKKIYSTLGWNEVFEKYKSLYE